MKQPVSDAKREAILRRLSGSSGSKSKKKHMSDAEFKRQMKMLSQMSKFPGDAPLPYGKIPHAETKFHDQRVDTKGVEDRRMHGNKSARQEMLQRNRRIKFNNNNFR